MCSNQMMMSSGGGYDKLGSTFGSSNYARLGTYAAGFRGIRPPIPTTTVAGYYVVPTYSAPGYDTLTHGYSTGGPYFSIGQAYGYGAGNCSTQYMGAICQ